MAIKKPDETQVIRGQIRESLHKCLQEKYVGSNGKEATGYDAIVRQIIQKALNRNDKDQFAAIKYIFMLLGVKSDDDSQKDASGKTLEDKIRQTLAGNAMVDADDS